MARLTVGATGQLTRKKIATLVAVTNESLESWSAATAANLTDIVSRTVRLSLDRSLLDPDNVATDARPASLTSGITASQSTGSSAAQIVADLAAAIGPVVASSADPSRIAIVMAPATALFLSKLLNAAGASQFPDLGVNGGTLWGLPVIVTAAAVFIGSPSANIVAVIDAGRVAVADDSEMTVDASALASISMVDNPSGAQNEVSFFQTETTCLRFILAKNFVRANDTAVAWFPAQY
jgi:HK97 family phage major capsid protein